MLTNLRLALRNLLKNGRFTLINGIGMAVGMACCFLIAVFLDYETHFDRFFPNGNRLYRVHYQGNFGDVPLQMGRIPAPIAPVLTQNFPQIEQAARLFARPISVREPSVEGAVEVENAIFADSTAQSVIGFEFVEGDPATALHRPFSMVLTEKTARLFFGKKDAMGKTLRLADQSNFTVTGIIRDLPKQSHLVVDLLVPFQNLPDVEPPHARENVRDAMTGNWLASYTPTYVLLKKGATAASANALFDGFIKQYGFKVFYEKQHFSLFPVRDIHQFSPTDGGVEASATPQYLRIFGIVGLLVLLIAGINFINLSTAVYLGRTREVAVRKALGAGRPTLIGQFLTETMLLSFVAFLAAIALLFPLIDGFNAQTGKFLDFEILRDWRLTGLFAAIFVAAGLLAGIYPALFATRFRPIDVFRQNSAASVGGGGQFLRKSLITVQFAVGIALLIGTLVMVQQLDFWKNRPLGFDGSSVVTIPLASPNINTSFSGGGDSTLRSRMNAFEAALLQNPNITDVTLANVMPGLGAVQHPVMTDRIRIEDNILLPCISVDYDFSETFKLQFAAGRDFDKSFGTDHHNGFIINELAVTTLGWKTAEEALGQKIARGDDKEGIIVGVVKNFHTDGLQSALSPLLMEVTPGMFTTFAVRLGGQNVPATLAFLEKTWPHFFPGKAFETHFLHDDLALGYQQEQRLARLCADFAGVAIFLSCFGLFGLISFTVRQRAKEVGIRKVLGASVAAIVGLLSRDFLKLVVLAIAIAAPVAYFLMKKWLADFVYRIEIGWPVFVAAALAAVLLAFLTVSFQSIKAALADPVKSLRSE